jgi:hypothetical protein
MTEFKSIYNKEELLLLDKDFLIKVILRQEKDIHNLEEEVKLTIREWKESLKSR